MPKNLVDLAEEAMQQEPAKDARIEQARVYGREDGEKHREEDQSLGVFSTETAKGMVAIAMIFCADERFRSLKLPRTLRSSWMAEYRGGYEAAYLATTGV